MTSLYLEVAERVLILSDRPLSAAEIISQAQRSRLLPKHLYGFRQDRTLQARLSEDIARLGSKSRFFRTSPGRYFLRDFNHKGANEIGEYYAKPRRKELDQNDILTLNTNIDSIERNGGPIVPLSFVLDQLKSGHYSYRSAQDILRNDACTAIHSFVVVHDGSRILSFRCGKFFPRSDPLFGRRTIGLSGTVTADQVDMLFESLFGIIGNAIEELCSGIGLPRHFAERARYGGEILPWFGVKSARAANTPAILHMVLSYKCPPSFRPTRAALSVNDLRWIDPHNPLNTLQDFDSTSKILLSEGHARDLVRIHTSSNRTSEV
ncbi:MULTISPECIES: winged helix-turn-helix domain-containing protein [Methylosinus]|uniref:HTH HARE-type domain-containing protein n=1 Tax=Methylosinus trichosporium (strain ATCC 35070 / NCIMB 11131 / UNIQEM 75 / OB3b) TaxID=595536 RepID=A0A2D2D1H3_METT3|nr:MULTISPECIES: winged helix-turn-helix domain-containing protein [Methylosinus]ATQ68861.1 hypothetical protein CQW49_13940 [Methylosinus trichosporium OB3b]